jgi:hypothetical protein
MGVQCGALSSYRTIGERHMPKRREPNKFIEPLPHHHHPILRDLPHPDDRHYRINKFDLSALLDVPLGTLTRWKQQRKGPPPSDWNYSHPFYSWDEFVTWLEQSKGFTCSKRTREAILHLRIRLVKQQTGLITKLAKELYAETITKTHGI